MMSMTRSCLGLKYFLFCNRSLATKSCLRSKLSMDALRGFSSSALRGFSSSCSQHCSHNEQQDSHVSNPSKTIFRKPYAVPSFELKARRRVFVELFLKIIADDKKSEYGVPPRNIVIIPSATRQQMAENVPFVFRQNSDFMYLSGYEAEDSVFVLDFDGTSDHRSTLFVKSPSEHDIIWKGPQKYSESEIIEMTGADEVKELNDVVKYFDDSPSSTRITAVGSSKVWYLVPPNPLGHSLHMDYFVVPFQQNRHGDTIMASLLESHAISDAISLMRLFKSPIEIDLMTESMNISSESFVETMKYSVKNPHEHLIFAKMDFECRKRNARFLAYLPVVAGGNNACTIHYIDNSKPVDPGHMVLMDAGGDYSGYASDITRTWPVSGTFTDIQKSVYEAVLEVEKKCIAACVPGEALQSVQQLMLELLCQQLSRLGVFTPQTSDSEKARLTRVLCPHHVSHYLGMDIHDTPTISRNRLLLPNMVVTVEPGLYFPANNDSACYPKEFSGIGVRIEDDILITDTNGPIVMTKSCPKEIDELETLLKST